MTDHEYNACRNAIDAVAAESGAEVAVASIPFPVAGESAVVEAVLEKVSPRTRLLLIDHVTSQTGMVMPIERLVDEVQVRGIDVLVDGAHAPGMVALDLDALGATYYTGNLHKWVCAPKGAAFLHVREDRRDGVRPLVISHGANAKAGQTIAIPSRARLDRDPRSEFLVVGARGPARRWSRWSRAVGMRCGAATASWRSKDATSSAMPSASRRPVRTR